MSIISLSEIQKNEKFKLSYIVGYKVKEIDETGRCIILGADKYIDNDFPSIDDVLLLIRKELHSKGFNLAA